jgi:hypothetical protein
MRGILGLCNLTNQVNSISYHLVTGRAFWAQEKRRACAPAVSSRSATLVALFFARLLAIALAGERLLHALLFARLEVEGVPLHLFDDVLGLHLPLETTKGILERLTFLYANLCQSNTPQFFPVGNTSVTGTLSAQLQATSPDDEPGRTLEEDHGAQFVTMPSGG